MLWRMILQRCLITAESKHEEQAHIHVGQNHAKEEVHHQVYQRPAEKQGRHRTFKAQINTHEKRVIFLFINGFDMFSINISKLFAFIYLKFLKD